MAELLVAIALMSAAVLPLAYTITSEAQTARQHYQRAVAAEIVDGEMELLMAGEWRAHEPGTRDYPAHAAAATNLPAGRFLLTLQTNRVRLEWRPAQKRPGGPVVRESILP